MRRKIALLVSVSFIIVTGISIDSVSSGQMAEYVGTETCKSCHWKQYRSWAKTKMANTFQDSLDEEQRVDPDCIVCHTTGYRKPTGFVNDETTPLMAGVQCEACHGAGSLYYTDEIMRNRYASMQLGLVEQNEKTCVTCHNDENPFFPGPFTFDKSKGVHEHFPMSEWFKKHQYDR